MRRPVFWIIFVSVQN